MGVVLLWRPAHLVHAVNASDSKLFPRCKCGRPAPIGKVKCARCLSTKKFKVVQGKAVTKGSNARGVCLHKADKSRVKRAKRQQPGGLSPQMSSTHWGV